MINMTIENDVKKWLVDEGFYREEKFEENVDFHYIVALNVQITYLRRILEDDHSISIISLKKKGYILQVSL